MKPMLQAESLVKRFGGVTAVGGVSIEVGSASIVGLIGPNGSGKTTTLNLLNGALPIDGGSIRIDGTELAGRSSARFVRAGITRTFQSPRVFSTITALENLLVPVLHHRRAQSGFRAKAQELLDFVGLGAHRDTVASELSGGQQKLLEFVRALMTDPRVVLMDEPFAGVHPSVKQLMRERIAERNAEGTSFLIVSHEIPDLTRLCSTLVCMAAGHVVATGKPNEVTANPFVVEAYLGHSATNRKDAEE